MRGRSVVDALALLLIVGTYWTIEVFYAWGKAWGTSHFDVWYTPIAFIGIGAGLYLFLRRST